MGELADATPHVLTFMEAFSSEASYWAGVFNRPKITVSRWPDKADFSADGSSCKRETFKSHTYDQ